MRVATKYSMDDVQNAVVRVIKSLPSDSGIDKAIARLAFIAEFPGHFYKHFFKTVFIQACSTKHRPSGSDLKPLMAFPNLVALMMQYREGIIKPDQAIWNEGAQVERVSPSGTVPSGFGSGTGLGFGSGFGSPQPVRSLESSEDKWLDKQLESLGLTPFLAPVLRPCFIAIQA